MYLCYVDEAGCLGALPTATSPIQPVLVVLALAVPLSRIVPLTHEFLKLKRQFFPSAIPASAHYLDSVLFEIKGAELRKSVALGIHRERRHALGFLDRIVDLLHRHEARIFGRAWIKGIGAPFKGRDVYNSSIQYICAIFQNLLADQGETGFVVADSRKKPQNASVSHSIFTQKFQTAGDPLDRVLEMPTFGHSDNHVGIQLSDLLCSALLFPMAIHAYCQGYVQNLHVRPGYSILRSRYGNPLRDLQYRFQDPNAGRWRGGITVSDTIGGRHGGHLFKV